MGLLEQVSVPEKKKVRYLIRYLFISHYFNNILFYINDLTFSIFFTEYIQFIKKQQQQKLSVFKETWHFTTTKSSH